MNADISKCPNVHARPPYRCVITKPNMCLKGTFGNSGQPVSSSWGPSAARQGAIHTHHPRYGSWTFGRAAGMTAVYWNFEFAGLLRGRTRGARVCRDEVIDRGLDAALVVRNTGDRERHLGDRERSHEHAIVHITQMTD